MRVAGWIRPGSPRRARGLRGGDHPREVGRGHEAAFRTRRQDRLRDAACMAFFTKRREDAGELSLGGAVDEVEGGETGRFIEAHVRRRIRTEAEAASRVLQLVAGQAKVEERGVERQKSGLRRDRRAALRSSPGAG